jgi:hypothetical protein
VPERDIPIPATVSPATQAAIARPLSPIWNEHPKSAEEWKVLIARVADGVVATLWGSQGFPPTIVTSGTRDLFLSNTVRVRRKTRSSRGGG